MQLNIVNILSLISLLITIYLIIFSQGYEKNSKFKDKFIEFLVVIFIAQLFELLCRLKISIDFLRQYLPFFQLFTLSIGYQVLSLTLTILNLNKIKNYDKLNNLFYTLTIFIYFICFGFETENYFLVTESFGYVVNFKNNEYAIISRAWIGICYVFTLIMLLKEINIFEKKNIGFKLYLYSILITGGVGFIGQIIYPIFFQVEIPLTALFMPIFMIQAYYLLKNDLLIKYNFTEESINIFNKANIFIAVMDTNQNIKYSNQNFNNLINLNQNNKNYTHLNLINEVILKIGKINKSESFLLNKENETISFKAAPLIENKKINGYILIGIIVSQFNYELEEWKNSLKRIISYSLSDRTYFIEYDSEIKEINITENLNRYLSIQAERRSSIFSFFLKLRNNLSNSDLQKIINYIRLGEILEKEITITYNVISIGTFLFKIKVEKDTFKKRFIIVLIETTNGKKLNTWTNQNIYWIISHVFRKNVANIIGLINLYKISNSNSTQIIEEQHEIIDIIEKEIIELETRLIEYTNKKN